jgi:hypothetical protein
MRNAPQSLAEVGQCQFPSNKGPLNTFLEADIQAGWPIDRVVREIRRGIAIN